MEWSRWLETWALWSRLSAHRRTIDRAISIARDGAAKGRMYCSLSGGKDSVALAGVLVEAGLRDVQCAHASSELNLPDSLDVCEAVVEKLDLPALDIVEPLESVWDIMARIPGCVTDADAQDRLYNQAAAGNLLVEYGKEQDWDGWFDGRRAEEARGRRMNFMVRSPLYERTFSDRCRWACCPLAWWKVRDVFAFLVSRDLPIHPFYRRCCEEMRLDPETLRVDWLFAPEHVQRLQSIAPIKRLYPALWRRVLTVRPEAAALQ